MTKLSPDGATFEWDPGAPGTIAHVYSSAGCVFFVHVPVRAADGDADQRSHPPGGHGRDSLLREARLQQTHRRAGQSVGRFSTP